MIWEKFALNCCINAIAATTGLRGGELTRLPELDAFQDRIITEVMAVTDAMGVRLPTPDLPAKIKAHSRKKFNQPSMLQHVEAGRRTEIDALNGALLREASALGIPGRTTRRWWRCSRAASCTRCARSTSPISTTPPGKPTSRAARSEPRAPGGAAAREWLRVITAGRHPLR